MEYTGETWSGRTDSPYYVCGCDPISDSPKIIITKRHPCGMIEQLHEEMVKISGIPRKYFGRE